MTTTRLVENLRLVNCAIIIGGVATCLGLLAAFYVRVPGLTPNEVWAAAVAVLTAPGGVAAGALLVRAERRDRGHATDTKGA